MTVTTGRPVDANECLRDAIQERNVIDREKQSSTARSNQLNDPQAPVAPKNRRGQQLGKPAPHAERLLATASPRGSGGCG
ncbi:MAG: hypothetical protein SGI77_10270 [Pirellulaceae bacterium]|nr:hypothetical protein [Pirellulaceae bacterium]